MENTLLVGLSRQTTLERQIDVIANNIANSNTVGFKESRAEFADVFCQTRAAYLDHDAAKSELKKLVPEDAREAIGHGVRARRTLRL